MPHCTSDMRDQDDEINHKGISRRDEVVVGFYLRRILRRDKIAIAGSSFRISRGGFSPGKPSMQEAAFAFADPCLERISPGTILPRETLDAGSSFRICRPLPGEDLPGDDSPQGICRKQLSHLPTLAWRGSPQGRILPRVTLDAGSLSHLLALAWGGFSPGQTSRLDLPSSVRAVFVPLIASLPAACCPPR